MTLHFNNNTSNCLLIIIVVITTIVSVLSPESNTVTFKSSIPTIFNFKPNSNELVVVNSDALDRETKPTYTFTVNVTDSEGLWSTATVIVTLSDINDVVPVITNSL